MSRLLSFLLTLFLSLSMYGSALGDADYQEEFSQAYDLTPGGTVSVKDINGSITIASWDQARVQVEATKKGKSKEDVDAIRIEIDSTPNRLNIATVHPKNGSRRDGVSVSYRLTVPRNVNLDRVESVNGSIKISDIQGMINVHTVNGSIKVLNSSGSTSAATVNGSITAELDQVELNKDMKLTTTNGSIKAYMPANINAVVQARTMNGGIRTDFPLTVEGKFKKSMSGTLGSGGPTLNLETVNGSVALLKR